MKNSMTLLGCIAIFLCLLLFIPFAGRFLIVNETPVKSDVIILLTGGNVERHGKAIELYKEGYASMIIVSNANEDGIYEAVLKSGVPQSYVLKEIKADSTYTNALYTLEVMKQNRLKSAIVVSSDYHMRRVKFNFDRVYDGSGIKLTYCAAKSTYQPDNWFLNNSSTKTTVSEYIKIIGNALGFNGIEDKEVFNQIKYRLFGY